jgi:type I restriction enzyme S subunit
MTLETFFKKFDTFADAPDAVVKMRELVLDLAATGRLLPHQTEWERRALKSLATKIGSGSTPAGGRDSYFSEGIPLIRSMNVHFRGFDATGLVFLSDEQAKQLSNVIVQPDDVLLNITGASIGRVTIAPSVMAGARVNQHVTIIRPRKELSPRFLSIFLASPSVQRMIDEIQVGATRQALTKAMIEQFEIPLPPLAEQKRIVAKVDELMALCDRLEAQQQERQTRHADLARASLARFAAAPTPANLHFLFHPSYPIPPADLRKSILTLAVQGKLVRFETENEAQTVGDHIEFQNGYAFKSQWFKPDGMRLCRNVNVSHGIVDWRESAFVNNDVAKEFERFALREGDIVLSLDRPLITTGLKVARIRKSDLPCLLLQRVAKPEAKHDQLDMSYFFLWLNSPEFVDSIAPGRSNGVPHISTRQVRLLPFVLPPLAEQQRIVAKVEQLMALVDALEKQLAASRATAKNLLEALVAELTSNCTVPRANGASHPSLGQRPRRPLDKATKG